MKEQPLGRARVSLTGREGIELHGDRFGGIRTIPERKGASRSPKTDFALAPADLPPLGPANVSAKPGCGLTGIRKILKKQILSGIPRSHLLRCSVRHLLRGLFCLAWAMLPAQTSRRTRRVNIVASGSAVLSQPNWIRRSDRADACLPGRHSSLPCPHHCPVSSSLVQTAHSTLARSAEWQTSKTIVQSFSSS